MSGVYTDDELKLLRAACARIRSEKQGFWFWFARVKDQSVLLLRPRRKDPKRGLIKKAVSKARIHLRSTLKAKPTVFVQGWASSEGKGLTFRAKKNFPGFKAALKKLILEHKLRQLTGSSLIVVQESGEEATPAAPTAQDARDRIPTALKVKRLFQLRGPQDKTSDAEYEAMLQQEAADIDEALSALDGADDLAEFDQGPSADEIHTEIEDARLQLHSLDREGLQVLLLRIDEHHSLTGSAENTRLAEDATALLVGGPTELVADLRRRIAAEMNRAATLLPLPRRQDLQQSASALTDAGGLGTHLDALRATLATAERDRAAWESAAGQRKTLDEALARLRTGRGDDDTKTTTSVQEGFQRALLLGQQQDFAAALASLEDTQDQVEALQVAEEIHRAQADVVSAARRSLQRFSSGSSGPDAPPLNRLQAAMDGLHTALRERGGDGASLADLRARADAIRGRWPAMREAAMAKGSPEETQKALDDALPSYIQDIEAFAAELSSLLSDSDQLDALARKDGELGEEAQARASAMARWKAAHTAYTAALVELELLGVVSSGDSPHAKTRARVEAAVSALADTLPEADSAGVSAAVAALGGHTATIQESIAVGSAAAGRLQKEADALLATIAKRLRVYKKHPVIPRAFLTQLAERRDTLAGWLESDSLETRALAVTRLRALEEEMLAPSLMTSFFGNLGQRAEHKLTNRKRGTGKLGALRELLNDAALKSSCPGRRAQLKEELIALQEALQAEGPAREKDLAPYEKRLRQAIAEASEIKAIRDMNAALIAGARKNVSALNKALKAKKSAPYPKDGPLLAHLSGIQRASGAEELATVRSSHTSAVRLAHRVREALDGLRAAPSVAAGMLLSAPLRELLSEKDRWADEKSNKEAEYTVALRDAREAAKRAGKAGANKKDRKRLKKMRRQAEKLRKTDIEAATARMRLCAQQYAELYRNPKGSAPTAKNKLPQSVARWKRAHAQFLAEIQQLADALEAAAGDPLPDRHRESLSKARAVLLAQGPRLLSADRFDAPVQEVLQSSDPRKARAAREGALRVVREMKGAINGSPLVPLLMNSPFAQVGFSALAAALDDLDLNIQRAL